VRCADQQGVEAAEADEMVYLVAVFVGDDDVFESDAGRVQ
jgi:hypothetical protein